MSPQSRVNFNFAWANIEYLVLNLIYFLEFARNESGSGKMELHDQRRSTDYAAAWDKQYLVSPHKTNAFEWHCSCDTLADLLANYYPAFRSCRIGRQEAAVDHFAEGADQGWPITADHVGDVEAKEYAAATTQGAEEEVEAAVYHSEDHDEDGFSSTGPAADRLRRGLHILDIGCGSSRLAIELAQKCQRDGAGVQPHVTLYDISPHMVALLRQQLVLGQRAARGRAGGEGLLVPTFPVTVAIRDCRDDLWTAADVREAQAAMEQTMAFESSSSKKMHTQKINNDPPSPCNFFNCLTTWTLLLDKGTLDALDCDEDREAMMARVMQLLQCRATALFVSVSFATAKRLTFLQNISKKRNCFCDSYIVDQRTASTGVGKMTGTPKETVGVVDVRLVTIMGVQERGGTRRTTGATSSCPTTSAYYRPDKQTQRLLRRMEKYGSVLDEGDSDVENEEEEHLPTQPQLFD